MLIKFEREGPYPQLFCVLFVSLWPFFMIMNGDRVDAMDSSRDGGMQCAIDCCGFVFYVFGLCSHDGDGWCQIL
jgi:hypothetical protein